MAYKRIFVLKSYEPSGSVVCMATVHVYSVECSAVHIERLSYLANTPLTRWLLSCRCDSLGNF